MYLAHGPVPARAAAVAVPADLVAVPADLVAEVRDGLGIDATPTAIHRGQTVSRAASGLGARAFSQDGQVFLPDEAGPLEDRETRALLVHELVHADQQRELGSELPAPASAAGLDLEAEAVAAERWYLGDAPPPTTVRPPAARTDLGEVVGRIDALDALVADLREQHDDARGLDRLAGRLYHHIRSRLRAELILDRERAGMLADLGSVR